MTTVRRPSTASWAKAVTSPASLSGSSPVVGSSRKITEDRARSAPATAARLRCPPDRSRTGTSALSSSPSVSSTSCTARARSAGVDSTIRCAATDLRETPSGNGVSERSNCDTTAMTFWIEVFDESFSARPPYAIEPSNGS